MLTARIAYIIRRVLRNFGAYPMVHFLAVMTIGISLFIPSAYLFVYFNLTSLLTKVGEEVHISAYLSDFLSEDATNALQEQILAIKEVDRVEFITKEEALLYLSESFGGQADVLEGLEENPLPASIEVMLKDEYRTPDDVSLVASKIERMNGVEDVIYAQEWLARFHEAVKIVRIGGIAVAIVLSLAAVAIVSNTVRLIVFARKDEIEIMRLVGATRMFITAPLVVEGMIQGALGAGLAVGALWGLFRLFMEHYYSEFGLFFGAVDITFFPHTVILYIILAGVLLGMLGGLFSFGRSIRV
jgi:cell division transport system permease protein